MGLGLSALAAMVLLLPGIAFVLSLNRLLNPASPPSPFEQHFSVGLLLAIGAAMVLHLIGLAMAFVPYWMGMAGRPSPSFALLLLAGDLKAAGAAQALAAVERYPFHIGGYFLLVSALGIAAGQLVNRRFPARLHASWADLLDHVDESGKRPDLAVFTTEVVHGAATWLYSGYLDDYSTDRDGRLERVVLRGYAARRLLAAEEEAELLDDPTYVPPTRWVEIPGEIFVLQMAQARTVNVDFFFDVEDDDAQELAGRGSPHAAGAHD